MENNGRSIGMALGVFAVCSVAMAVFAAPSGKRTNCAYMVFSLWGKQWIALDTGSVKYA